MSCFFAGLTFFPSRHRQPTVGRLDRRIIGFAAASGLLALFASGCAHHPINARSAGYDPSHGYRISTTPAAAGNSDELFIILAFSGGGTRAAAFSYGVMEKLRDTKIGHGEHTRRLLDEVDVISSVSGGSFTAAYYGLYRDRLFSDFANRFLYKNVTAALALRLCNPLNWAKLASPHYDRIDMAADYYAEQLFDHKTFGDLAAVHARPFIVLNATDMTLATRFEFTQDQFDLISSDLSTYPVARGVAASSAFPVLLSPLTLTNYPGYPEPQWIRDALASRQSGPRDYANARAASSYLSTANRPYIHLLDGGLADNLGLRGPAQALFSAQNIWGKPDWNLMALVNSGAIKRLVIITVNAKAGTDPDWNSREKAPGVLGVLSTVTGGPMDNYTSETVQYVRDTLIGWQQAGDVARVLAEKNGTTAPTLNVPKFYAIELTIADVKDPAEREILSNVKTDFHLTRDAAEHVTKAARQLLDDSPEFQQFLSDLARDSSP